jgi:predicted ATPase
MNDFDHSDPRWEDLKTFFISMMDRREAISEQRMAAFSDEVAALDSYIREHVEIGYVEKEDLTQKITEMNEWAVNIKREMQHVHAVINVHNESYVDMHNAMTELKLSNEKMIGFLATLDSLKHMIDIAQRGSGDGG